MIILFGPAGAGKSVQGHLLAARFGWRWLSAGQILRDEHDPAIMAAMEKGELVPDEHIRRVMRNAIAKAHDIHRVILDGFPRHIDQAQWLVETQTDLGRDINLVIVLDLTPEVIKQRLHIRGRVDDAPEIIDRRLVSYRDETEPVLQYLADNRVAVVHVDGAGTVGQVHDAIVAELTKRNIV